MSDPIQLRRHRRFAGFYLLLGAALLLISVVAQPGVYTGSIHGQTDLNLDGHFGLLTIDAQSEPAWYWVCRRNHRYQRAEITIPGEQERTLQVDLVNGTWECNGQSGLLSVPDVRRLIFADMPSGAGDLFAEGSVHGLLRHDPRSEAANRAGDAVVTTSIGALLDHLRQMRDGVFLRPRHQPYTMQTPFHAWYQHLRWGTNYGQTAVGLWLLIWPIYLGVRRPQVSDAFLSPSQAFLATVCCVGGLGLLSLGIHVAFAPGQVGEMMELLMGLLNLPAMCIDDRAAFSWQGLAFSGLVWAFIGSMALPRIRRRTPYKPGRFPVALDKKDGTSDLR